MSKNGVGDSCAERDITRKDMENMSEFRAACCLCGKVHNGTKLPSLKDPPANYKLNCCLVMNPTDEGIDMVFHYDKKCQTRGSKT